MKQTLGLSSALVLTSRELVLVLKRKYHYSYLSCFTFAVFTWYFFTVHYTDICNIHCVSKNVPPYTCYNLYVHGSIATIFGKNVAEKVGNQNVFYFPTSPK